MSSIITIGGDLVVGRIGFGAMQLTGKQVWGYAAAGSAGLAPAPLAGEFAHSGYHERRAPQGQPRRREDRAVQR